MQIGGLAGMTYRFARTLVAVLAASAASASAGEPGGSPLASPPGLEAAQQPGLGRGDFDFSMDAASVRPGSPGKYVVRVLTQLPVRALLQQTQANQATVSLHLAAFDAPEALRALTRMDSAAAAGGEAGSVGAEDKPDTESPESADSGDDSRNRIEQADRGVQGLLGDFEGVRAAAVAQVRGTVQAAARAELRDTDYQLLEISLELPPGDYVLEAVAKNLSRTKRGLLDRLRHRSMSSVGRVLLRVPDLAREPALADLTFQCGHGSHADYASRLYGLLNDSLHVRTGLYATGRYQVHAEARDRNGAVHWADSLDADVPGRRDLEFHTSVNTLPAGQYALHVTARGPQGSVSTTRSFDVAWSLVSWKKSQRDLDLEAQIVLTDAQYDSYRSLPLGEKERFLEDFWTQRDPTPDTAHNELLDEFQRRVAYADMNFSESRRGALSDRGKVYIRFGPPQEVQSEAVAGHLAGRGAEAALEKVDDAYVASEHGGSKVAQDSKEEEVLGSTQGERPWERAQRKQEHGRVVGPGNEVSSYELWIYTGSGQPLLAQDKGIMIDAGLRILFIDLEGYGRYGLRKSSARLPVPGLGANY
jgi:GWxTD domain-containing protein